MIKAILTGIKTQTRRIVRHAPSLHGNMARETDAKIRKTLWAPLCKRAEVEYRNPYQIRHTYASARLTAGENPWYMAEQLGHVDVQMVFRVYGKFIRADYQKPKTAKLKVVGRDS